MYKVLIVDDEPWVVESLKTAISWESHGFEIAGQASSGLTALALIKELEPDLVFTDIRMPEMGGLEVIKHASDGGARALFVVVSGHAEFAYAQKALNYGALGYCLKPFDEAELIGFLNKAKKRLNQGRLILAEDLLDLLIDSTPEGLARLRNIFKEQGLDFDAGPLRAAVVLGKSHFQLPEEIVHVEVKTGPLLRVLIFYQRQVSLVREFCQAPLTDLTRGIGISKAVENVNLLKDAIETATVLAYQYFITGQKGPHMADSLSFTQDQQPLKMLREACANKDLPLLEKSFEELRRLCAASRYSIKNAFYIYNFSLSLVYRQEDDFQDAWIDSYRQLPDIFENAARMLAYLHDQIRDRLSDGSAVKVETHHAAVQEILEYVNHNFFKDISVADLSRMFFINPNYISQLFKKEVGSNFTEYLTRLRMNYACRLLKESKLSIEQIGEKCGYNDYFYFAKVFKREMGKTPTQYRTEAG